MCKPLTKGERREFIVVVIVFICALLGLGSAIWFGRDDQPIEELSEAIIEEETGVKIDLTPGSKET